MVIIIAIGLIALAVGIIGHFLLPETSRAFWRGFPDLRTVSVGPRFRTLQRLAAQFTLGALDKAIATLFVFTVLTTAAMGIYFLTAWKETGGAWDALVRESVEQQLRLAVVLIVTTTILEIVLRVTAMNLRIMAGIDPMIRIGVRVLTGALVASFVWAFGTNVVDLFLLDAVSLTLSATNTALLQALVVWGLVHLAGIGGIVLVGGLRAWQAPAVGRLLFDPATGAPLRHPEYQTNAAGEVLDTNAQPTIVTGVLPAGLQHHVTLDANGELVIGNGSVTIAPNGHLTEGGVTLTRNNIPGGIPLTLQDVRSGLARDPEAGRQRVDERTLRTNRLHVGSSVAAVMLTFATVGYATLYLGVATDQVGLMLLGAGYGALVLIPVILAGILAEAAAHLPLPERLRNSGKTLGQAPWTVLGMALASFAVVLAFPSVATLAVVGMVQLTAAAAYSAHIMKGGKDDVSRWTKRTTLLVALITPAFAGLRVLWSFIPDGETKQTVAYRGELIRDFANGHGYDPESWKKNLLGLVVGILAVLMGVWLSGLFIKEKSNKVSEVAGVLIQLGAAVPGAAVAIYCMWGLFANIFDTQVKLPGGLPKPVPVVEAPTAPADMTAEKDVAANVVHLKWRYTSQLTTGATLERRTSRGIWLPLQGVGAEFTDWDDSTVKPGETYCYRVVALNTGMPSAQASDEACVEIKKEEAPPLQETGTGQPNAGNVQPPQAPVATNGRDDAFAAEFGK